ncbi:hypothetical protein AMTRI_Chr04g253120 [Amborella trichopoda]
MGISLFYSNKLSRLLVPYEKTGSHKSISISSTTGKKIYKDPEMTLPPISSTQSSSLKTRFTSIKKRPALPAPPELKEPNAVVCGAEPMCKLERELSLIESFGCIALAFLTPISSSSSSSQPFLSKVNVQTDSSDWPKRNNRYVSSFSVDMQRDAIQVLPWMMMMKI